MLRRDGRVELRNPVRIIARIQVRSISGSEANHSRRYGEEQPSS
jgi:hypothetical protein